MLSRANIFDGVSFMLLLSQSVLQVFQRFCCFNLFFPDRNEKISDEYRKNTQQDRYRAELELTK